MNQYEIASSKQPQSKNRRRLFKVLGCFIPLLACAAMTAIYANRAAYGVKTELVALDFGDGYTIRVWVREAGWLETDYDPDHLPVVIYEVTRFGNVVKPASILTASSEPFIMRTIYAEERNLIGIYDAEEGCRVFIVLDGRNDARWLIGDMWNDGQQRWIERFRRLKQENADLPYCYE